MKRPEKWQIDDYPDLALRKYDQQYEKLKQDYYQKLLIRQQSRREKMPNWKPISEADTNKIYIALCIHEEDSGYESNSLEPEDCQLTPYAYTAEGDHIENGLCLICYRESYQENEIWGEYSNESFTVPGCWTHYCGYDDPEKAANPVFFLDIDLNLAELIGLIKNTHIKNVEQKILDSIVTTLTGLSVLAD